MKQFSHLLRQVAAIFLPPFEGLGLIVILFILWAHLVFPHNDIMRGNLPDPDDYMYLTQVLDWVKGQNWFDNIQHRMDPPNGVPIQFSRLAQLPLAASILCLHKLGLPWRGAATFTALVEPFFLLGLVLVTMRKIMSLLTSPRWAGASSYVTLFSTGLLFEFMPGHVDHHGLIIVIIMAALFFLLKMFEEPYKATSALYAGFLMALSMVIALETLPWLLLMSAYAGLWSISQGGKASLIAAVYAVSVVVFSFAGLAVTRLPADYMTNDILTYSVTYCTLSLFIAVPFIAVACAAKAPLAWRAVLGLGSAFLCGELFLRDFPELIKGPYGAIDAQLQKLLLDDVIEALPIMKTPNGLTHLLNYLGMPFIGFVAALTFIYRSKTVQCQRWTLLTLMLGAAISLTIFYQYRFLGMASALAIVPLTALLEKVWIKISLTLEGRVKVFAEIGLLLLVGPLPAVLLPALIDARSLYTGVVLFPVDGGRSPCDMAKLEGVLRDPNGLGRQPHTIASFLSLGPELLFRTDSRVLAAPFHMNVQGNLDAARFFSTPYESEAHNILERRGIDLIVACRLVPNSLIHGMDTSEKAPPSMIDHLMRGHIPEWLEVVPTPQIDNFVLFTTRAQMPASDQKEAQPKKIPRK